MPMRLKKCTDDKKNLTRPNEGSQGITTGSIRLVGCPYADADPNCMDCSNQSDEIVGEMFS